MQKNARLVDLEKMLTHEYYAYVIAKIGVDSAEIEPDVDV